MEGTVQKNRIWSSSPSQEGLGLGSTHHPDLIGHFCPSQDWQLSASSCHKCERVEMASEVRWKQNVGIAKILSLYCEIFPYSSMNQHTYCIICHEIALLHILAIFSISVNLEKGWLDFSKQMLEKQLYIQLIQEYKTGDMANAESQFCHTDFRFYVILYVLSLQNTGKWTLSLFH